MAERWLWETDEYGEEYLVLEESLEDGEELEFVEWSPSDDDDAEDFYLEPEKELN